MGNSIKNFFRFIFSKDVNPNNISGYFDIKQYHSLKYALIYAKNELILENEGFLIYSRNYKDVTLVNILIEDENEFVPKSYTYDKVKELIINKGLEAKELSIVIMAFKNKNDKTISMCKSLGASGKNGFIQGLVYDETRVTLDYYLGVPDYLTKLNEAYCEDMYFDFAAIDPTRD